MIMYISAKFSGWPFKLNILGKMIVLGITGASIFAEISVSPAKYQIVC